MRGAALLAMRLQLLLAQAACAHGGAPTAGDEAAQGSGRGAARRGRGGRGGCPGQHEPARTARRSAAQHSAARHSAACARALHRALSLLEGAGAACLEELGETYPPSMATQAAAVAGPGREGAAARAAGLGDSRPPALEDSVPPSALATLGEQLQACARLQRGSLAAPCHRHALRLLGTAREQLRGAEARLAAGRQQGQGRQQGRPQGRPRPQQGGVASELAHLCGRLAVSSFALGRQQEGASWLKEAAQHLLRTPPRSASASSASSSSSSRAEHAQLSSQLEQEHRPLALARMCSSLRTSRA